MANKLLYHADKSIIEQIKSTPSKSDNELIQVLRAWCEKCQTDYEITETSVDWDSIVFCNANKKLEKIAEKQGYSLYPLMYNLWEKVQHGKSATHYQLINADNERLTKELEAMKTEGLQAVGNNELAKKNKQLYDELIAERNKSVQLEKALQLKGEQKMAEAITEWEYKIIDISDIKIPFNSDKTKEIEKFINKLGSEGWELVTIVFSQIATIVQIIFKRPKKNVN